MRLFRGASLGDNQPRTAAPSPTGVCRRQISCERVFLITMLLPTFVAWPFWLRSPRPDYGPVISGYVGLILLVCSILLSVPLRHMHEQPDACFPRHGLCPLGPGFASGQLVRQLPGRGSTTWSSISHPVLGPLIFYRGLIVLPLSHVAFSSLPPPGFSPSLPSSCRHGGGGDDASHRGATSRRHPTDTVCDSDLCLLFAVTACCVFVRILGDRFPATLRCHGHQSTTFPNARKDSSPHSMATMSWLYPPTLDVRPAKPSR